MATNNNTKISISAANRKMGEIPSVSLPPVVTCAAGVPCAKKCYACKLCRIYPFVKSAYNHNYSILNNDPAAYWLQVTASAMVTKYFRFHVSGDIPTAEYFNNMIATAEKVPTTEFLCFTKQYSIVNNYIDNGGEIPANLHIIFSRWDDCSGWNTPNPYRLPESTVIFKGEDIPENVKVCGGNCAECACRGVGCWELKNGETIAFYEH